MVAKYAQQRYLDPVLRELWDYNPETGVFTWKIKTRGGAQAINVGDEVGSRSRGYVQLGHHGKNYLAHILAWVWMTGDLPPQGKEIDHENRIRSDNRWINLRLLSHGSNMVNGKQRSDNTTGVTGVYRHGKRWFARIYVDGELVHLGYHDTFAKAAAARKRAEALYWELQSEET